jgi:hypothetical protein
MCHLVGQGVHQEEHHSNKLLQTCSCVKTITSFHQVKVLWNNYYDEGVSDYM